jgi:hypothetical protein
MQFDGKLDLNLSGNFAEMPLIENFGERAIGANNT